MAAKIPQSPRNNGSEFNQIRWDDPKVVVPHKDINNSSQPLPEETKEAVEPEGSTVSLSNFGGKSGILSAKRQNENSNPGPFNSIQSRLYKDIKLITGLKPLTPTQVFIDLVSSKGGNKLLSDIGKLDFGGEYQNLPRPEPFFNDSVMLVAIFPSINPDELKVFQKEHWLWLLKQFQGKFGAAKVDLKTKQSFKVCADQIDFIQQEFKLGLKSGNRTSKFHRWLVKFYNEKRIWFISEFWAYLKGGKEEFTFVTYHFRLLDHMNALFFIKDLKELLYIFEPK